MADKTLDVRSEVCPMPVVRTKDTLKEMSSGETLEVIVDYPPSKENVKRYAINSGNEVLKISDEGGVIKILIKKVKV